MFVVLSPGYALGQQQDLISLKVSDVPFVKVLEEIRKQSGYNFMYNEKFTRNVGRITLEVKNLPLETVMEKVVSQMFGYIVINQSEMKLSFRKIG